MVKLNGDDKGKSKGHHLIMLSYRKEYKMKLSNSMKKILAYVCAITMVISSVAFSGPTTIKASDSASVDGRIYTVTDGDASIAGFTCQGIFDKARIHFAWGTEVDAASITATVDGKSITVDGKNAHGMFIPLTEVSGLADGEYPIVVTATTTEDSKEVTGNATLKIEDEGETTTRDPSVKVYVDLGEGFSYDDSTTASVIGIQQPDWAAEKGIYMNVPAGISTVSVNGNSTDEVAKIQGAGVIVYVSALTKKTNNVEIEYAGGKATVVIINANGTDDSGETTPEVTDPETTTEAPETTTEAPETTTEAPETTTASSEITMDQHYTEEDTYTVGGYSVYVGPWMNSTAQVGVDPADPDHIKVQQLTSNYTEAWGVQVKKALYNLKAGEKYTIEWPIVAASNDGTVKLTEGAEIKLTGGAQTLRSSYTAKGDGTDEFVVGMGWVNTANPIEFFAPVVKDAEGNVVDITKPETPETTTEAPETTTEAPETTTEAPETTTVAPETTTVAPETSTDETTTVAPATTTPEATTQAPTTTKKPAKKVLKKTKITKATRKSVKAKKIKLTFKRVKNANKYKVEVSTSKKFKKALVRKTVKKVSVTITGKALKNKKKLYVRVRAVGAKKWAVKQVKIKK